MANLMEVLRRMMDNEDEEDVTDKFAQTALQKRFQPNLDDVGQSAMNTARSYANPRMFQASTPEMVAQQRMQSEMAPLAQELQLQNQSQNLQQNMAEGPLNLRLKQAQAANYERMSQGIPIGAYGGGSISGGASTRPIKPLPGDLAGKLGLSESAFKELSDPNIDAVFNKPDFYLEAPSFYSGAGEVGRAKRVIRQAVEAGLRLTSGAAVPNSEVDRYTDLYMPNPTDTLETRKQKLQLLRQYLGGALDNIKIGRGLPDDGNIGLGDVPPYSPVIDPPMDTPSGVNDLTPEEEQELQMLREKFGR